MRISSLILSFLLVLGSEAALASSPWQEGFGYKARLVDGILGEDGTYKAGFEVVLEKGWKTYWRVPGENGVPPLFKFDASTNMKEANVHWPAPVLFKDGEGVSVGYKHRVLLPFTIVPQAKDRAVHLNLSAFFGVCSEICVPVDANMSVLLDPKTSVTIEENLIDEALSLVPVSASSSRLDVRKATLHTEAGREFVDLALDVPVDGSSLTVLAEGSQQGWYLLPLAAVATKAQTSNGYFKVTVPLYRHEKVALKGDETVRVTVITDGEAIEKTVTLQ